MISVVTITYNNPDELKDTLNSLQAASNIQSIVINGGKTPETLTLLKDYPTSHAINESDRGIADAFNKGALASQGEAIAFLNSGDILLNPNYYVEALEVLQKNPGIDFIYADLYFVDPIAGKITFRSREKPNEDLGLGMPFPHPTLVVRKSVFGKVGPFNLDYKIGMDYEWVVRLLKKGSRGKHLTGTPVLMDGNGVSSHSELKGIQECQKALEDHGLFHGKVKKDFKKRMLKFKIRTHVKNILGTRALKLLKRLSQR